MIPKLKNLSSHLARSEKAFPIIAAGVIAAILMAFPATSLGQREGRNWQRDSMMVGNDLPVYPGATVAADARVGSDRATIMVRNARVRDISAARYVTHDSPDRILNYYRARLRLMGDVVQCNNGSNERADVSLDNDALTKTSSCNADNLGTEETELKAGDESHQHIVAVRSRGSGTEISLVHVCRR